MCVPFVKLSSSLWFDGSDESLFSPLPQAGQNVFPVGSEKVATGLLDQENKTTEKRYARKVKICCGGRRVDTGGRFSVCVLDLCVASRGEWACRSTHCGRR